VTPSRPLATVLDLHQRGLFLIPVDPGTRRPLIAWGHVDDHGHPDGPRCRGVVIGSGLPYSAWLRYWWERWPDAGAAVLTGRSRLLLVDSDPRHDGDRSLRQLCRELALPRTLTVRTRGGGLHLYYRLRQRHHLRKSTVGKLAPGLDVRSERGLAVCPPTPGYEVVDGAVVAEVPAPLLARCPAAPTTTTGTTTRSGSGSSTSSRGYQTLPRTDNEVQSAIAHTIDKIKASAPGARHSTVYGMSRWLFGYCIDDDIDELLLQAAVHDSPPESYKRNYKRAISDARRKATGAK